MRIRFLLLVLCLCVIACDGESRPGAAPAPAEWTPMTDDDKALNLVRHLRYVHDPRTDLCFAVSIGDRTSFTQVACWDVPPTMMLEGLR